MNVKEEKNKAKGNWGCLCLKRCLVFFKGIGWPAENEEENHEPAKIYYDRNLLNPYRDIIVGGLLIRYEEEIKNKNT